MWNKFGSIYLSLGATFASAAPQPVNIPQRIVSVSVPGDEILAEVLTRCGKKEGLVAVSALASDRRYADVPAWALAKDRASDSLEKIVALRPSLVIASSFNRVQLRDFLQRQTFQTYVMEAFANVEDILAHILRIASLTQCEKVGVDLVAELRRQLAELKSQLGLNSAKTRKVLFYASQGYTYGRDTPQNSLANELGLRNIAAPGLSGWSKISTEKLLTDEPDFIVISSQAVKEEVQRSAGLRNLNAVKKERFVTVSGRHLDSLSQTLIQAGEQLTVEILRMEKTHRDTK